MTDEPLDLDALIAHLAARVGVGPDGIDPDADLRAAYALDSLQKYELLVAIEDLGVAVPDALFPHLVTARDIHTHYRTALGHRS